MSNVPFYDSGAVARKRVESYNGNTGSNPVRVDVFQKFIISIILQIEKQRNSFGVWQQNMATNSSSFTEFCQVCSAPWRMGLPSVAAK